VRFLLETIQFFLASEQIYIATLEKVTLRALRTVHQKCKFI